MSDSCDLTIYRTARYASERAGTHTNPQIALSAGRTRYSRDGTTHNGTGYSTGTRDPRHSLMLVICHHLTFVVGSKCESYKAANKCADRIL